MQRWSIKDTVEVRMDGRCERWRTLPNSAGTKLWTHPVRAVEQKDSPLVGAV